MSLDGQIFSALLKIRATKKIRLLEKADLNIAEYDYYIVVRRRVFVLPPS